MSGRIYTYGLDQFEKKLNISLNINGTKQVISDNICGCRNNRRKNKFCPFSRTSCLVRCYWQIADCSTVRGTYAKLRCPVDVCTTVSWIIQFQPMQPLIGNDLGYSQPARRVHLDKHKRVFRPKKVQIALFFSWLPQQPTAMDDPSCYSVN